MITIYRKNGFILDITFNILSLWDEDFTKASIGYFLEILYVLLNIYHKAIQNISQNMLSPKKIKIYRIMKVLKFLLKEETTFGFPLPLI
jgi:hypothetical protein